MKPEILARAFVLVLAAPLAARAADCYVDAVNGDDANGGTSPSDAWRTLSHAMASAPGDCWSLFVAPGLYDAALGESFPIPLRSWIDVIGVAGADVTIVDGDGAPLLFDASQGGDLAGLWLRDAEVGLRVDTLLAGAHLTLSDAVVSDMSVRGITGVVTGLDTSGTELLVELTRVTIRDCALGVYLLAEALIGDYDWTDAVLDAEDSRFLRCVTAALVGSDEHVESQGRARLVRCLVSGIERGVDAESLWMERSTAWGHADHAVSGVAVRLESSILYGNAEDVGWNPLVLTVRWCDTGDGLQLGQDGNISADPLFVDPGADDFRLRFASPCVDAGEPGPWFLPIDGDLDTEERVDMGASELAPLALSGEPRIGATVELELLGPAGGAARVFLAPGPPVDPPTATPFGDFDLVSSRAVFFADAPTAPWPPAVLPVPIPDDPALIGRTFSLQALATSTVRTPRVAWTNPVTLTIEP